MLYIQTMLKADQFMYKTNLLYLSSRLNMKDIDFLNINFNFALGTHYYIPSNISRYSYYVEHFIYIFLYTPELLSNIVMQVLYSFYLNF